MEGLWEEFLHGWRAAIASAWPEVVANGIWDPDDPARLPYDAQAGFLNVPFAALGLANLPASDNWGGDNRVWEPVVEVWYVMEAPLTKGAPLRARLEHLADYLEANDLPVGQLIPPEPELAMADLLPPNALLMLLSATQRAGRLRATCVLGVTRS